MKILVALTAAGIPESRLDAALRSEHARLHDLAAVPRSYLTAARQRRHGIDLFTAYAAQHLAASAEVLLDQARNWPSDEVSRYLSNLRLLGQALRVLKRREYGDKRYLDFGHDEIWQLIDQLLCEHEQLESMVAARIAADSDRDALAALAEKLMTSQNSAADDLEEPVVPAQLAALEARLYGTATSAR